MKVGSNVSPSGHILEGCHVLQLSSVDLSSIHSCDNSDVSKSGHVLKSDVGNIDESWGTSTVVEELSSISANRWLRSSGSASEAASAVLTNSAVGSGWDSAETLSSVQVEA